MGCRAVLRHVIILAEKPLLVLFGRFKPTFTRSLMLAAVGAYIIPPQAWRLAIVFGVVIVAAVILGRVFCGWVCPFGLYLDLITRLRKALRIKRRNFSDKFNERFHQLSYIILAVIIIISVVFGSQAIAGTQLVPGTQKGGFV